MSAILHHGSVNLFRKQFQCFSMARQIATGNSCAGVQLWSSLGSWSPKKHKKSQVDASQTLPLIGCKSILTPDNMIVSHFPTSR